jgi:nicotinate-nucleotide adenylyltransferase
MAPAKPGRDGDTALPPHGRGLRIGLLGGSFNPAHAAHRQISLIALRRLGLDAVWWLVTPGNPLKDTRELAPLAVRIAAARTVADHPRIRVTGVEARFRTRYTIDTLRRLIAACPGTRFVWLMGADNLASFHRWKAWQAIAGLMPIAVIDRTGRDGLSLSHRAVRGRTAQALARHVVPAFRAGGLARRKAPAIMMLHDRRSALSSSLLRAKGLWSVAGFPHATDPAISRPRPTDTPGGKGA